MPRNGSGTMSTTNTFATRTTIGATAFNANFADHAAEITNSLPRDGQSAMTGQMKAASGTVAAPGLSFGSDTNTGLYLKSADTIGVVAGGAEVASIGATGILDAAGLLVSGVPTGALMMYGATSAPSGWVRMNGRTIGNAASSASERANADTSALYAFLWTNYADAVCAVSTGRGASAAADYAANKTITMPDMRGRAPFGLDDMGNSAASRLTTIAGTTNGTGGGAETVTLAQANLPNATLTGTAASNGAHTHTTPFRYTSAASGGAFNSYHIEEVNGATTETTSSDGAHTHTVTTSSINGNVTQTVVNKLPPAFVTTFIMKL